MKNTLESEEMQKSRQRIKDLTTDYVKQKKQLIQEENKEIDKRNADAKKEHKKKNKNLIHATKFNPEKHQESYSIEKLIQEINSEYYLTLTYQKYNQYINGHAYPKLDILHALSKKFGVTLDYICGYDDNKNPYVKTVSEILPLEDQSLDTLIKLCSDPNYKNMLNALLSSPKTTSSVLQSIRNPLKQRYKQKVKIQKKETSSSQELLLSSMFYEELLAHLENAFLPLFKAEFDRDIMINDAFVNKDTDSFSQMFQRTKTLLKDSQ